MGLPKGKTVFLWQIKAQYGGNPQALAEKAEDMGVSAVLLKAADGSTIYNQRQVTLGWKDDLVGPLIAALAGRGIRTWGWQYIYGVQPAQEAQRAVERMQSHGFAGWVIDAEGEMKGKENQARLYMELLRKSLPDALIGLTTYRYPTLHRELPWKTLMQGCDFQMPQVYWAGAHNPGEQLERCVREYRELERSLKLNAAPIIPVGAAYRERGWQPTADEMVAFVAKVRELELPGYSMWEWGCAQRAGLEQALMDLDTLAPVVPPVLSVEERLDRLEKQARLAGWRI